MGLPCISTDCSCGGPRALIADGENGLLTEVKDIDGLYKAMAYFVENPDTVAEMGAKGRKMAEEIFNVNIVNKKICENMGL